VIDSSLLPGIVLATACGAAFALVALAAFAHRNGSIRWRPVVGSVVVALVVALAGVLVSVLFAPDGDPGPPGWIRGAVAAALTPGSALMWLLGPRALDTVPYFGGFALNIVVWSILAYVVISRRHGARA
jgi:hypothetical protein